MKAGLAFGAIAAVALSLGASSAFAGATLDRVNKTHTMVNVLDQSYPPFSFLNDKNEMDGFDIDVAKEIAKRLGVTLKTETPSWEVITAGHWQGRWDVCICSMTPNKERAEVLDFAATYYSSPAVLVVAADNTSVKSIKDLDGKKVGAESGASYEKYLQKSLVIEGTKIDYPFKELIVTPYESEDLAYQDLALGAGKRVDGVVGNLISAKARVEKEKGKFRIVGDSLYQEPDTIAVDKGDPEWKAKLAAVVADMRKDGTLTKISQKWLGLDVTK